MAIAKAADRQAVSQCRQSSAKAQLSSFVKELERR